ncbi:MAG TPA: PQQ-dependent sugar dehydrogenase, partial [Blastococcus sp.]|nr:PQQ-dependent sugar dehydrogenase [Blastococcus sp.]
MRRSMGARAARVLPVLLLVAVLTGCGDDGYQAKGPFRPLPEGAPPEVGPPTSQPPVPGDPAQPGAGEDGGDPNVVASGLAVPTGVALLPDGSAIVGERDTGRLLQVFPDRSPPRELMTVPGLDTSGDGGLLGLAVSPTYAEDGLFYAYITTTTDNRVVRFPLGGTPNPVFTGIPRGATHNGGGLLFGPDGHLYVGTGDTGDAAVARAPGSLAGTVLRIDVFGRPAGADAVFTRGHRDVTAICL